MQKSPPTPTSPLALLRQQPWPAAQCISAVATLWVKAAFGQGTMNPMVLVVYRQGIATLVLVPVTVVAKRTRLAEINVGAKGFFLVFVGIFFGYVQNLAHGSNSVYEPLLPRASPGIVVAGDGHDELDSCYHLPHGISRRGPICNSYMDPLTLSTLSCFFSTLQSATLAFFVLPDQSAWKILSLLELSCYIFVVSEFS
nr:unnamed protein product [Digitaria exilis]